MYSIRRIKTARKSLKKCLPIDLIANITDLSIDEIKEIETLINIEDE